MKVASFYSPPMKFLYLFPALFVSQMLGQLALAQQPNPPPYNIGSPVLTDRWVDPVHGADSNSGATRASALRTLNEAWNRIPISTPLTTTGFRIRLVRGVYPESNLPNYMESRYGTLRCPIIIEAADGRGSATLEGDLSVYDCRYLYLLDFNIVPRPAGDTLHLERCHHVLMRGLLLNGGIYRRGQTAPYLAHDNLKVNQCQHIYLEDCEVKGADDNAVDFVAVQYGHALRNRVHNSQDWCMYVKGGSSYFTIEGNEFFDGGTGGFTCGQGTGFQFMVPPWLHYEAENIKVVNNLIHDTEGAGLGVNGGYNILLAYNTLVRVGSRSHMLEVVFGSRSCDGTREDPLYPLCGQYLASGGWGTSTPSDGTNDPRIPNRNVFVFNNIFYNPPNTVVTPQIFTIAGPVSGGAQNGSNVPQPAETDRNLRIEGNVIWTGNANTPLGIEEADQGAQPSNPTCNANLLRTRNRINTLHPQLIDPARGDYRPRPSGNIFSVAAIPVPPFPAGNIAQPPIAPSGNLSNGISRDLELYPRNAVTVPGAIGSRAADFNGDGEADYVLARADGRLAIWYLDGASFTSGAFASQGLPADWKIAASGDFNGDRTLDLVLENETTHRTVVWYFRNSSIIASSYGPTLPTDFGVAAAADFNADGRPDLLLSNPATRQTRICSMNGVALVSEAAGPTLPAGFQARGAADFNGDGRAELLIFNPSTRQTAIWFLNGASFLRGSYGPTLPPGYDLAGATDFFRDSQPDLLLTESATRRTAIWRMRGVNLVSGQLGPTLPAGYTLFSP